MIDDSIYIAFHTKNTTENMFIFLIFRVCNFWREKDKNTATAALNHFGFVTMKQFVI